MYFCPIYCIYISKLLCEFIMHFFKYRRIITVYYPSIFNAIFCRILQERFEELSHKDKLNNRQDSVMAT